MLTLSLFQKKTFWSACISPFMQRSPFICSSISSFIVLLIIQYSLNTHILANLYTLRRFWQVPTLKHKGLANFRFTSLWTNISPQNKFIMSKEKQTSNFEKTFTTYQTFRRNKHYYDALKVTEVEQHNEKRRRKPKIMDSHKGQKIEYVFQSAKKQREGRLNDDIDKFRFRMSFYSTQDINPEQDNTSTRYPESGPTSPRNIKAGIPHDKLLSRESLQKLRNKPCIDERQFNNFYITTNDLSQTPHIGKKSPRNLNIALEHMTDLYYNSQKKYEELYFDNRTNSCTFDLRKQKDKKGRYFFIPQLPQNLPHTDMKPENVAKSFSVATPFKPNKILNFYKINGRELPCQLDQRKLSPNCNFYKSKEGKLIRPEMSFTARRYKEELLARDAQELKAAKRPYFSRDQVCDEIYFKQERRNAA